MRGKSLFCRDLTLAVSFVCSIAKIIFHSTTSPHQVNNTCLCGACVDSCDSPSCGGNCKYNGNTTSPPTLLQFQYCGRENIQVEFNGCSDMQYFPQSSLGADGTFWIEPPDSNCTVSEGLTMAIISSPVQVINITTSCSEELFLGQTFGQANETVLIGSCIERGEGTFCNSITPAPCDEGEPI